MTETETPDERKARLLKNLEKARAASKKKREEIAAAKAAGEVVPVTKKRPKHLDKIIRELLDDPTFVDAVVTNQPAWWNKLPEKRAGYIMSAVMTVKAMGGDIKAAEWVAKRGFGDKVVLDTDSGFFAKDEFTIKVIPAKGVTEDITSKEILDEEIKQIEDGTGSND